jgi:hypothetical protein
MTIRAVAVVPHPPLLIVGVGGATDPLADLRASCLAAIRSLGPGPVVMIGDRGSLATSGQPLSLQVGSWLAAEAGVDIDAAFAVGSEEDLPIGDGVALLVVADGTAARGDKPPAGVHPDAQAWDDRLAAALATADTEALRAFDPPEVLQCQGAPAFRALGRLAAGRAWTAGPVTHEAPFGVAYLTALWTPET